MRLADLLETPVFDSDGAHIGHVQDVRLIQNGPTIGTFGAAPAIEGLIVGKRKFGERLGFHRTDMHGPPLLQWFFETWHRGSRYVPWERVETIADKRVTISCPVAELEPPEPISG